MKYTSVLTLDWVLRRADIEPLFNKLSPAFATLQDLKYYMTFQNFTFQVWRNSWIEFRVIDSVSIRVKDLIINFPEVSGVSLVDKIKDKSQIGVFCVSVDYHHTHMPEEYINYTIAAYFAEFLSKYIANGRMRPAVGYPACPDHSLKKFIFKALNCDLKLTEQYSIIPTTSICGFLL